MIPELEMEIGEQRRWRAPEERDVWLSCLAVLERRPGSARTTLEYRNAPVASR